MFERWKPQIDQIKKTKEVRFRQHRVATSLALVISMGVSKPFPSLGVPKMIVRTRDFYNFQIYTKYQGKWNMLDLL